MATAGLIVVGSGINRLAGAALVRRKLLLLERAEPIDGFMQAAIDLGDGTGDMLA